MDNSLKEKQKKLDVIQYWLGDTTEPFDDWDYNSEELVIFLNQKVVERYNNLDVEKLIIKKHEST